ncbi:sugar transferase [Bacillus songklensis]|uniref:Sugar transferase n=1 Tax=Bacillus songklensis TaxID=1069116 RepID=A0ABV8B0V7_9BACI
MKRMFDFIFSSLLLLFLSPLIFLIALLVRIHLGAPVFFKQLRPGLHGKPFLLYKFRTMTDRRDENGKLLPDSERLTAFGKFLRRYSMDEIPQLFNVMKGELSMVGPRPLLMEYLPLYTKEQMRRHEVKPGITGWAQVNGRNSITWEEKFKLDVWYVDNQSFFLDLKILLITILLVLRSKNINQPGQATIEFFKGNQNNNGDSEVDR